jgi:hypothetical protein
MTLEFEIFADFPDLLFLIQGLGEDDSQLEAIASENLPNNSEILQES